jgi:hypothetical protein
VQDNAILRDEGNCDEADALTNCFDLLRLAREMDKSIR